VYCGRVYSLRTTAGLIDDASAASADADLLVQIPLGAVPVAGNAVASVSAAYTRNKRLTFSNFAPKQTTRLDFYFPQPGTFPVFPAHVGVSGTPVASAAPMTLVVAAAPPPDATSWEDVAARGKNEEVLRMLTASPGKCCVSHLLWRLEDKEFYLQVVDVLRKSLVYAPQVWQWGFRHADATSMAEFLKESQRLRQSIGPWFNSSLVHTRDESFEHLEYLPLVNPRIHARSTTNKGLRKQILAFARSRSLKATLEPLDYLIATIYLLHQDRTKEAIDFFQRSRGVEGGELQRDYVQTYLHVSLGQLEQAKAIAARYLEYPILEWRRRFRQVANHLDMQVASASVDATAGHHPAALDFTVNAGAAHIVSKNVAVAAVAVYAVDVEVVLSSAPFCDLDDPVARLSFVKPTWTRTVQLTGELDVVQLPPELMAKGVLIQVVGEGITRRKTFYHCSLIVHIFQHLGSLRVLAEGNTAAPGVYIKVFSRHRTGKVNFYKDGYTDLNGQLSYVERNGNALDGVVELSVLILDEQGGTTVRRVAPPESQPHAQDLRNVHRSWAQDQSQE